jgi:hypothetical protein
MSWVRENTPEDAVFGHWWDYGYWVQSIGERATILDGGNQLPYWNHLMGRHALTGSDNQKALDYLYAHGGTHFLIDSTDIGKYSAFSSIGSDEDYDRASWIVSFVRDPQLSREQKNSTLFIYRGSTAIDGDIIYQPENGSRVFLPGMQSGVGGFLVERDSDGTIINPVEGIYVYNGVQYEIPLRYAYDQGNLSTSGRVQA